MQHGGLHGLLDMAGQVGLDRCQSIIQVQLCERVAVHAGLPQKQASVHLQTEPMLKAAQEEAVHDQWAVQSALPVS